MCEKGRFRSGGDRGVEDHFLAEGSQPPSQTSGSAARQSGSTPPWRRRQAHGASESVRVHPSSETSPSLPGVPLASAASPPSLGDVGRPAPAKGSQPRLKRAGPRRVSSGPPSLASSSSLVTGPAPAVSAPRGRAAPSSAGRRRRLGGSAVA